jgi:mannose-6-phosphate isomerase
MNSFARTAARLREWAAGAALPLWASEGFDAASGRFEERLTLNGKAIVDVPIRLLVQARQIYSFAVAARRDWHPRALDLVDAAYSNMVTSYHRSDGRAGWVFSVRRDGSVAESKRDFYAHAFVLLAVASYVEVTGRHEALKVADDTLSFLDAGMRGRQAGYVEAVPASDPVRRQNPHMHLFEALLALWRVTSDQRYLARAQQMFELFRQHFFEPGAGVLREYYDEELAPAANDAGEIVEPGHHYEWVWLLRQFERVSADSVQPFVDALYGHADRYGYNARGLIVDELTRDGRVRTASHRVWPVTEAIKANVVEAQRGRGGSEGRVDALVDSLFEHYLRDTAPGGWIDRLNRDGQPDSDFMPASTLYHIMSALDVLHGSTQA